MSSLFVHLCAGVHCSHITGMYGCVHNNVHSPKGLLGTPY